MNRSALHVLVSSGLFACAAAAQCATQWLPGGGAVGTDAGVRASTMHQQMVPSKPTRR